MKPWSHDASELNPQDIPETYIYKNQNIEEYLKPSSHERKLFLIGAKGCGKTLLLRYKAYLYWNKMESDEQPGYRVSASNELVEGLEFDIDTLSRKELEALANLQTWKNIWKFALTLIVLRRLKIPLPSKLVHLEDDFPTYYRLSNIVTELVTNQSKYITSNFFRQHLNAMTALLNDLNSPFVLFIDRLDQALDTLLSNEEYKYFDSKNLVNIPFKVWQHAQFGLLLTSYNLTTATNRHIKIFATARREALDVETQLMANITSFCTFLDYDKNELKEIFEKNIKHTPKQFLNPKPTKSNLYQSFFGFETLTHIQAKDENQEFRKEHVFDFLLRHTFERPREVVLIGRKIYGQLLTRNYHDSPLGVKIELIRREVNNTSHEIILENYLKEVIPSFREEYIDTCARTFEQNLIYPEDLQKIDSDILNYLYRIGLIGFVRQGKQCFLPASKHIHNIRERLPKSSNYMLHPSLDHRLQQEHEFHDFYNESCIIGNGYTFYPPPLYSAKRNRTNNVDYYLPKAIPGKGSRDTSWEKVNILISAEKLFERYFIEETDGTRIANSQKMINNALKMLATLANLTAFRILRKRFNITADDWNVWEKNLLDRLRSFASNNEYSKKIKALELEDLMSFEVRIFGRLVAAGMLVYLETDYQTVRQALRTFSFNGRQNGENGDSAVRFLRQAFFLANLPNTTAPQTAPERRRLLYSLSDFEHTILKRWWLQYTHHILLENHLFQDKHIKYLNQILK